MKSEAQHNTAVILPLVVTVALGWFWLLPNAQAVVPAPDGGYPGGNTAEGQNALLTLTTGGFNTAVGWLSLRSSATGNFNTAIGAGTLFANTADQNTAIGTGALLSNTTATQNTAIGAFALFSNTTGSSNTTTGAHALLSNTTGNENTANGVEALVSNTTGASNTAIGHQVLASNTTGNLNTAIGNQALTSNTTDGGNTAIGSDALRNNSGGGGGNTAVGDQALFASTTGGLNLALGFGAGANVTTASNTICIGADGENVSNSCYIGQIFGATSSTGTAVFINSSGKLGTTTSSQRFKHDIKPMAEASELIFALKPVTFRYKKEIDPAGTEQLGLVAEDVERVNPDLVVRDKEGKPYSVRYDQVNAMLLNEFLKEHHAFVAEQRKVEEQQKEIDLLKAELTEQRSLIQKVSDSVELKRSTPQVVANKP